MKLYLHIGLSKTGTSAIQTFLYKNRTELSENFKVLYPDVGIFNGEGIPAHYYLAFSLFKPAETEELHVPKSFEQYIDELKSEIIKLVPEKLIISSEAFMHFLDEDIFIKMKEKISDIFEKIFIVVYLRRQDLWHESSYSQVVKSISTRLEASFTESTIHSMTLTWLLMYDNFLKRWKTYFPKATIVPRIYDRKNLPEGNVILDFLSILGINMPEAKEQKIEANPSLSYLSTLVMRKINEKFDLTPAEHGKVIQYLFRLDHNEGSPIKTFFTLPERIEFLEQFKESNERLFREWFNTENQFVLSEEEIKFYEEQDKIPKEEIEKLVEDRYRKVLAYLMEENIKPTVKILGNTKA